MIGQTKWVLELGTKVSVGGASRPQIERPELMG